MKTDEVAEFLDKTLDIGKFKDVSNNGLQIANRGEVSRVAVGVDASLRGFRAAVAAGANLMICHHGLSWGDSLKRITGLNYQLVSYAIGHGLAVYAAHLPLDAHPVYGNNAQLCKALGIGRKKAAFDYHGNDIGFVGTLARPMSFEAFCGLVRERVAPKARSLAFGKKTVRTIGVVSGGACEMLDQAVALGCDAYLTGEPGLIGYTLAENLGANVLFAGHYATETWGVKALGRLVSSRLKLPVSEIDFKIEY